MLNTRLQAEEVGKTEGGELLILMYGTVDQTYYNSVRSENNFQKNKKISTKPRHYIDINFKNVMQIITISKLLKTWLIGN